MRPDDFERIYKDSIYEISIDDKIKYIKIDALHPWLDDYKSWAYITAYNPHSQLMSKQENTARNNQLLKDIQNLKLNYVLGISYEADTYDWEEYGFLIFDISLPQAKRLASRYEQRAFIFGKKHEKSRLILY